MFNNSKSARKCGYGAIGQEKLCNFKMVGKYDEITAYRFGWTGIRNLIILLKNSGIILLYKYKKVNKDR